MKYGVWVFTYSEASDTVKFRSIFSDSLVGLEKKQESVAQELIGDDSRSFWGSYPTNRGSFQVASADFRNRVMSYKERGFSYAV